MRYFRQLPMLPALRCGLLLSIAIPSSVGPVRRGQQAENSPRSSPTPAATTSSPLHPTVSRIRGLRVDPGLAPGNSGITFDGFWLPGRFEATLEPTDSNYDPPNLEFSLVSPGTIELDGVTLEVRLPFYIATHELASGQLGAMGGDRWGSQFGFYLWQSKRWRDDDRIAFESLADFKLYMQDPDRPAIIFDTELAVDIVRQLNTMTNASFEVPSIGQWILAMRAGQPSRYWWGDSAADAPDGAISSIKGASTNKLRGLRRVGEGASNALGLTNMVGNVRELVLPSDEERDAIAARLTKRTAPQDQLASNSRPSCLPRGVWLALGGASYTSSMYGRAVAETELTGEIDRENRSWEAILEHCQVEFEPVFAGSPAWCSGIRLVLPIGPRQH